VDFDFHSVSNKHFCGGPAYYLTGKCWKTYQETLAMVSLPFDIAAMLTLFGAVFIYIGRYCCQIFGGKNPTHGICGGELRNPDEGYNPTTKRVYLFILIFVTLMVGVGMILAFYGNGELNRGINHLTDSVQEISTKVKATVDNADAKLPDLEKISKEVNPDRIAAQWTDMYQGLSVMKDVTDQFAVKVHDTMDTVRKYESDREQTLYWTLILSIAFGGLVLFGFVLPMIVTFSIPFIFVIITLAWVSVGVHGSMLMAVSDFCVGLDYALTDPTKASPIEFFVPNYTHVEPGAQQVMLHASGIVSRAVAQACETHEALCNMPAFQYPDKHGTMHSLSRATCPANLQCRNSTLATFVAQTTVNDFMHGCAKLDSNQEIQAIDCKYQSQDEAKTACIQMEGNTVTLPCVPGTTDRYRSLSLAQCAANCSSANTTALSKRVLKNDQLARGLQEVASSVEYYTTDKFVHDPVRAIEKTLCWDTMAGVDYVEMGCVLIAVFFSIGIPFYFGATKRFDKRYSDENWPQTVQELEKGSGGGSGETQPLLSAQTQHAAAATTTTSSDTA